EKSLASVGSFSILAVRCFLEALLYLSFPFVLLFSLLSFGVRMLLGWLRLFLWICAWPIFYVAIDLFLTPLWNLRGKKFLSSGLTLDGISQCAELYGTIGIVAFFALLSIPVFSWMLIRGGVAGAAQLASSLMQPALSPAAKGGSAVEENS